MFTYVRKIITSFFRSTEPSTPSPSTVKEQQRIKWIDRMTTIAIQFLNLNLVRPFVNQFFFEYKPDERVIIFFATRDESGAQFRPEDLLGNYFEDDWPTCSRVIVDHLNRLRSSTDMQHKRFYQRVVIAVSSGNVPASSAPLRIRWCLRSSVAPSTVSSSYMGPILELLPDSVAASKTRK